MSNLVEIEFKMPDYLLRLQQGLKRIQIGIAADIQTNIGLRFDAEGAYNGHDKWQDLKSGLNTRLAKNGLQFRQILRKSGTLKNSISPPAQDGSPGQQGYVRLGGTISQAVVAVGTTVKYARIHNEGGVIKHPGTRNGFGRGIKIPAHDIPMPRRNYTDWNAKDKANMEKMLKNTIQDILNGK